MLIIITRQYVIHYKCSDRIKYKMWKKSFVSFTGYIPSTMYYERVWWVQCQSWDYRYIILWHMLCFWQHYIIHSQDNCDSV